MASPPPPIGSGAPPFPPPVAGSAVSRRQWLQGGLAALSVAVAEPATRRWMVDAAVPVAAGGASSDDEVDGGGGHVGARDTPIDQLWEPWRRLLSPPTPAQARLIELGQVRFCSDPDALRAADRIALTRFDVQANVSFRFQHQLVPAPAAGSIFSIVRLTPTLSAVDLRHMVTLPEPYSASERSARRLLAHEFDHIAISADPRPMRILREIFSQPQRLREPLVAGQPPTAAAIELRVQAWRDGVLQRIAALIQSQYDQLDAVSRNGELPIADREQFFHCLYQVQELETLGLPVPATLKRWLLRQSDQDIQRHYALILRD